MASRAGSRSASGPLPDGSELELRPAPLEEELAALWRARACSRSCWRAARPSPTSFLRAGLVDKLLLFVAPKLVGGDDAPPLFAGPGARSLAEAIPVGELEVEQIGDDLLLTAYLNEP